PSRRPCSRCWKAYSAPPTSRSPSRPWAARTSRTSPTRFQASTTGSAWSSRAPPPAACTLPRSAPTTARWRWVYDRWRGCWWTSYLLRERNPRGDGMENQGPAVSSFGLDEHGIAGVRTAYWNLPPARLVEMAVVRGEAVLAAEGPLVCETGPHTGRSPNDKYLVKDPSIDGEIWWGDVNRPFERERFDALLARAKEHLADRDVFVFDGYAGADPRYRLNVRVITEDAWHSLFARNMFIREEDPAALAAFEPGFTVLNVAHLQAEPQRDGTRSP